MSALIQATQDDAVVTLTIHNPPVNALTEETLNALRDALEQTLRTPGVRALVLTGSGEKAFVAGADIKAFERHLTGGELGLQAARVYLLGGQTLMNQIERAPMPVIAAINGVALGGGLELALACHLRVAAPTARLGQPEINLGLIPAWGGTQRLPRLIGPGRALELILTGDPVDADTALRYGLVNAVSATPRETAQALAARIAAKGQDAVAAALTAHRAVADRPQHDGLQLEAELALQLFQTDAMREGVSAFLEKRAPNFNRA